MSRLIYSISLALLFFAGCKSQPDDPLNRPLVVIGGKELTYKELQQAIPDNIPEHDSLVFSQDYINRWVKSELLLRKAELNLSPTEKDVERLLNEYRTSLLIHKYQQKLLEQKYSPLITSSEIKEYYQKMTDNFKLNEHIIKGIFIKIPKTAPNLRKLKKLYKSNESEDLVELETYCFQNANKFDVFIDEWYPISKIEKNLPNTIKNAQNVLKRNPSYETSDSLFNYYLSFREYKLQDELAPIEYVNDKIKAILLNKKRLEFIRKLEQDLYDEGLSQKIIKFY